MRKFTRTVSMILAASLLGITGCSEKTISDKALEKKIAELQKQLDIEKSAKEEALKKIDDLEKEKNQQAINDQEVVVNVIDPNSKQILKSFHPKEMGFGSDDTKYKSEIEKWAKSIARGTTTKAGYDQRMIPDKIGNDGQVIKGKPRSILEESELIDKVMNNSTKGGTVELPLYITESGYKLEEATQFNEALVASYTTNFNSSIVGRSKNIELSAAAINNVIVGVGDIFSFNTTVGPSDAAHGYQKAPEAVNGKLVEGIGGGICQTSSTLYNAVDKLGVTYVEKHHHSLTVGYVPKGRDATVSYGGLDFRFQNTTGVPLLLKAYLNNGKLTVEVRTSNAYKAQLKQ